MKGIIISSNDILLNTITGNLFENIDFSLIQPTKEAVCSAFSKEVVHLLVIDAHIALKPFLYKVKTIINLSLKQVSNDEVCLNKPFKLLTLLEMVQNCGRDEKLFCGLQGDWVYNEGSNSIARLDNKIRLTDKENETIRALITAESQSLSRQELQEEVWKYHPEADSNTIDTHLYRLKQKLPAGILEINEGVYSFKCK